MSATRTPVDAGQNAPYGKLSSVGANPVGVLVDVAPDGLSFRVFAKQMTDPPDACGLSAK
jgi:hypothetical protein